MYAGVSLLVGLSLASVALAAGADDNYLEQAHKALEQRKLDRALRLADRAIAANPRDADGYFVRGLIREAGKPSAEAVVDFSRCLQLDLRRVDALDHRGSEELRLGRIKEAVKDFDRYLELRPDARAGHWKRGIALYYAGRFEDGKKQFARYEEVDTNDVENTVWHFLCAARVDGVKAAQKGLLKTGKDLRVPMREVYALFQGKAEPKDVLAAAEAGRVDAEQRLLRRFYAHLYLGLYYEIHGDSKRALEHIRQAATTYRAAGYMGDVAHVHLQLRQAETGQPRP
jgi:lipoprotein NlpI